MRILLIEDHPRIRESVARALRGSNYAVDVAVDGREGLWKVEDSEYDAIILDVMLPVMDGWTVLSKLRETNRTPVLMLTALDAVEDRIRGLDEGADDYLPKPFEMNELEARLRALIRRSAGRAKAKIGLGPYVLDLNKKQITRMGEPVSITALEYALIEFLAVNRGKVVSRAELYDHLFDEEDSSFSNTLDVRVSKIRAKLGKGLITTHRGLGYSINDYGLGSLNENLPGFVTLTPASGFGGAQNYGSAFLPAHFQGTRIGTSGRPIAGARVANLSPRLEATAQEAELRLIKAFNRSKVEREQQAPQIEGLIKSYELGYRMQSEMPGVMDIEKETPATRNLYGIDDPTTADFGRKCLLARRMVEAGVRFVEINHGDWDHHRDLGTALPASCAGVDKPLRGLINDLKSRGLLDDTLVIWGGEFGRTPHAEGSDGRDHNVKAFTMWMAGGGVKAGYSHGVTDDYGYEAVEGKTPIVDWHATILHLLGLDHEKLTYRHAGRDFRLTDVSGRVIKEIVA